MKLSSSTGDFSYYAETVPQKAVDLLYDIGEHILKSYNCFEL